MIAQDFEHTAIRGVAAPAFVDHALKLGTQRLQPRHALFDLPELAPGNLVSFIAGLLRIVRQVEKLPDCLKREPQLTGVANESKPVEPGTVIAALPAFRSAGLRHEADLLVIGVTA